VGAGGRAGGGRLRRRRLAGVSQAGDGPQVPGGGPGAKNREREQERESE